MSKSIKIIAMIENHFDQIWRRCFRRDIEYKGKNIVSYAKIEGYYIDRNIEISETDPNYKFQIENICTVETYLENFPEKEHIIRELYKKGVLQTTNTGYAIMDSNIIGVEALIRNYLISEAFFKDFVGKTPRIANRSDAFGNSAQLPQILRAFGADYVTEIYYNAFDDDVWVGLDKSAICIKKHPALGSGGGWTKYPPCEACNGYGVLNGDTCPTCNGKGIDLAYGDKVWKNVKLKDNVHESGVIRVGGEELLPNPETPTQVENIRRNQGVDISIGHMDYLLELYSEDIDKVNKGDFDSLKVRKSPEFNPNTTGGYTTRIKIKQRLRNSENELLAGETLEAMRYIIGKSVYYYQKSWRNFMLCGFHDSAAGTIVDSGYVEINDMFDAIDVDAKNRFIGDDHVDNIYVFNPTSTVFKGIYETTDRRIAIIKDLAPYSFTKAIFEDAPYVAYQKEKTSDIPQEVVLTGASEYIESQIDSKEFSIENQYFRITADNQGILNITDKRTGIICDNSEGIRPCEWILQSDNGSPWATLEPPYKTEPLSTQTELLKIEKASSYTRVTYITKISIKQSNIASNKNSVKWSFMLFDDYDHISFKADVNWSTANKRLMVAFPINISNGKDIYGLPGGWIERKPYEPRYEWNGADGDYPAFRYGGVQSDEKSVAIFNRGTPAYKILPSENGKILYMTVLRSPTIPVCLHEPDAYSMTEYDGMRDEGKHSFDFELVSYSSDFVKAGIALDAEQYYRGVICVKEPIVNVQLPVVIKGSAIVTHVKPAENGDGIIVRITEHSGENGEIILSVPDWVKDICVTDMPENKLENICFADTVRIGMRGFEIATLRFRK